MSEYKEVPTEIAKQISSSYGKGIVIIFAWDDEHGVLHITTYGDNPKNKVFAAKAGELCGEALLADLHRKTDFEDFRKDLDAGKQRAMEEAIQKHLPALKQMGEQIVHPKDNTFSRMAADFEKALGTDL